MCAALRGDVYRVLYLFLEKSFELLVHDAGGRFGTQGLEFVVVQ